MESGEGMFKLSLLDCVESVLLVPHDVMYLLGLLLLGLGLVAVTDDQFGF